MGKAGRWLWVSVCVVMLLACWVIGALGDKCFPRGCCFYNQSTYLECKPKGKTIAILLKGSSKLQEARIVDGQHVELGSNAVSNAERLHSIQFTKIKELTLLPNNKSQFGPGRVVSMTISQVGDLKLKYNAFFGWKSSGATLSVGNVESCHIASAAFPATTGIKRVVLENITSLTVEPSAFQATIQELILRNVTTLSCVSFAFGGSVDHLSLSSVTVDSIKSRCFDAGLGWKSVTVTSSDVGHISRFNVQGRGVNAADQRHAEEPTLPSWWSFVGVACVALLLLAAAALLVTACRRHLAGRRGHEDAGTGLHQRRVGQSSQPVATAGQSRHGPPADPARSGAAATLAADYGQVFSPDGTAADEEEAVYCEVEDYSTDAGLQGGSGRHSGIATKESMHANVRRGGPADSGQRAPHQTVPGKVAEDAQKKHCAKYDKDKSALMGSETSKRSAPDPELPVYAQVIKRKPAALGAKPAGQMDPDVGACSDDVPEYAEITPNQPGHLRTAAEQGHLPAGHLVDNALYGSTT